jgi:hypothetical protein
MQIKRKGKKEPERKEGEREKVYTFPPEDDEEEVLNNI